MPHALTLKEARRSILSKKVEAHSDLKILIVRQPFFLIKKVLLR